MTASTKKDSWNPILSFKIMKKSVGALYPPYYNYNTRVRHLGVQRCVNYGSSKAWLTSFQVVYCSKLPLVWSFDCGQQYIATIIVAAVAPEYCLSMQVPSIPIDNQTCWHEGGIEIFPYLRSKTRVIFQMNLKVVYILLVPTTSQR